MASLRTSLTYGAFPLWGVAFQQLRLSLRFVTYRALRTNNVLQPREFTGRLLLRAAIWQILRFGLDSLSLAATNEIPIGLFSSWY